MKAKNGISLIVLVITIVVIIILAAAVILSLGSNNPINSSRMASIAQTRDNLESAVSMYVSTAMTKTLGEYDATAILLNDKDGIGEGTDKIWTVADGATDTKVVISTAEADKLEFNGATYYKINTTNAKTTLEIDLTKDTNGTWYFSPKTGKALVKYATIPTYLMDGDNVNSSVSDFVYKAPATT